MVFHVDPKLSFIFGKLFEVGSFCDFFPDILLTVYIPGGARWRFRSLIFIMSGLLMVIASVLPRCWQLFSSNHLLKSAGLDTIRQTGLQ